MTELKNLEIDLEELKELYSILQNNFLQLSKNKKPTLNYTQVLGKIQLLKKNATKLEKDILALTRAPKIIRTPSNIIGPVAYMYLEGDPGDGITRKMLLLGDVHIKAKSCPPSENNVNIADFFRFTAAKLSIRSNKVMDLFIEETFGGTKENTITLSEELNYLNTLKEELSPCLKVDKSRCDENMRIHYADVRHIMEYDNSLEFIWVFLNLVQHSNNTKKTEEWLHLQPQWDSEQDIVKLNKKLDEIKQRKEYSLLEEFEEDLEDEKEGENFRLRITNALLDSYRLDKKRVAMLSPEVERKIIQPLFNQLYDFLSNRRNRVTYHSIKETVRECLDTESIIPDETKAEASWLAYRLLIVTNAIMEAYFIVRMLKPVGKGRPPRPDLALKPGERMTHIAGYFGYGHLFNLERSLHKLGFITVYKMREEEDLEKIRRTNMRDYEQCIAYNLIEEAVERFCE